MPCSGPSESEIRDMERNDNRAKFGKSWTDYEWAENTACAYVAFVRHHVPLPKWAVLWGDEHEAKDQARQQAEKNRQEQEEEAEYKKWVQLNRKFGKKG